MMPAPGSSILRVNGTQIVDDAGNPFQLNGVGLAGWLSMENWITGYPAHEEGHRSAIKHVLGPELRDFFFDRFIEHFFNEADAAYLASMGINTVRIPFHYRFLESDDAPFEIRPEGFQYLDKAIRQCAAHNIYTLLDLHVVPGWQNQDWHCDNPTHTAQFWQHRQFQDRVVNLWKAIASHYKNNPWVLGYNPINEPADPTAEKVGPLYTRLVTAIREIDTEHMIFLDGNRYALDFDFFGEPLPNVIYSPHNYPAPSYTPVAHYPGPLYHMHVMAPQEGEDRKRSARLSHQEDWDAARVERDFLRRTEYTRITGTPIVVGEFNTIFPGEPTLDNERTILLADELAVFRKYNAGWIYWSYKDVGLAAPLTVAADSPWMRRIQPVVEKKARLAVDLWSRPGHISHILDPIRELVRAEFPDYCPFPWGPEFVINRLIPQTLFAQAMLPEFGELFRGMTEEEIDAMMRSFRLENCVPRESLVGLLREAAQADLAAGQPGR